MELGRAIADGGVVLRAALGLRVGTATRSFGVRSRVLAAKYSCMTANAFGYTRLEGNLSVSAWTGKADGLIFGADSVYVRSSATLWLEGGNSIPSRT